MSHRVFKTKPFAKLAGRVGLKDVDLCNAAIEMRQGLVDANLGGGVLKKRVATQTKGKRGGLRTIVATNFKGRWVFMYVFAKSVRANINWEELEAFRKLADVYRRFDASALNKALLAGELLEICHAQS